MREAREAAGEELARSLSRPHVTVYRDVSITIGGVTIPAHTLTVPER
jgi:hypothetical protein